MDSEQIEARLRELENCTAVHEERFSALLTSLRNTEDAISKRADEIFVEVDRQRDAQRNWVTLERFESQAADIRHALELQATEYERRLEELNHEHQRTRAVQAQSVTADKFDDYVTTQQRALEMAVKNVDDKFTERASVNAAAVQAVADRMLRVEEASVARRERTERESDERARKTQRTTTWLVAGLGAFMTGVVILVNVIMQGMGIF